jgi:hypothetical protein
LLLSNTLASRLSRATAFVKGDSVDAAYTTMFRVLSSKQSGKNQDLPYLRRFEVVDEEPTVFYPIQTYLLRLAELDLQDTAGA